MSITPFQIYLWQQLDSLISTCGSVVIWMTIISVIGAAILAAMRCDGELSDIALSKSAKVYKFFVCPFLFITLVLYAFLPTSKTVAMMIAIPAIIDSKPIQKDLPDVYNMALEALKNQINTKNETK